MRNDPIYSMGKIEFFVPALILATMLGSDISQRLLAAIGKPSQAEQKKFDVAKEFLPTFKSAMSTYIKDVIFDRMQKIGSPCIALVISLPSYYEDSMRLRMIQPLIPEGSVTITKDNYFAIEKWMEVNKESIYAMWKEITTDILDEINDSILLLRHASLGGVKLAIKETPPLYFEIQTIRGD